MTASAAVTGRAAPAVRLDRHGPRRDGRGVRRLAGRARLDDADARRMPADGQARPAASGERVFRALLAVPGLYDAFHFPSCAGRTAGRCAPTVPRPSYAGPGPGLASPRAPPELAISVFATGAAAPRSREGRHPGMSHAVFCTDVVPHRLWVHAQHRPVPGHLGDGRAVRAPLPPRGPRRDRAGPGPAAVLRGAEPDRARAALGVPADARCVLLMGGAWGLGPSSKSADVAGRDAASTRSPSPAATPRLEAKLRAAAARQPRLHPVRLHRPRSRR